MSSPATPESDEQVGVSDLRPTQWRQGDCFALEQLVMVDATGNSKFCPTPSGVAIVSQTCDVVIAERPNVQIAPVVRLEDQAAIDAAAGKRSRYAQLPSAGEGLFVDLDLITTIDKSALVGRWRVRGVASAHQIRRLSGAIARRFGRFAFPDAVSDSMKVLRDLVQSRAPRQQSPLGALLVHVLELRAECEDWSASAPSVTLVIVTRSGVLPFLPDDGPKMPSARAEALRPTADTARARLTELASALTGPNGAWTVDDRHWLWQFVGEATALLCQGEADRLSCLTGAVSPSYSGEVVDGEDYSLARSRRSEIVDLDHLSAPLPLDTA